MEREYTDAELEIIDLGDRVEALMKSKHFDVLKDEYMAKQALYVGLHFDGDTKALEAITHLSEWLNQQVEQMKVIRNKR